MVKKIPLLAMVMCISLAVVVTETLAAVDLANHHCSGNEKSCPVCLRAKAAAEFLDTLRLVSLFLFFSICLLLIPEMVGTFGEYIPEFSSLITLEIRKNT